MAERDAAGLPYSDSAQAAELRGLYEAAVRDGDADYLQKAFNLAWALVHSRNVRADVPRGQDLVEAMLHSEGGGVEPRELRYLQAVAEWRQRRYLPARRTLKALLAAHPDFRQAAALLDAVDAEVVRDGVIGVGVGAAVVGGVIALLASASRR